MPVDNPQPTPHKRAGTHLPPVSGLQLYVLTDTATAGFAALMALSNTAMDASKGMSAVQAPPTLNLNVPDSGAPWLNGGGYVSAIVVPAAATRPLVYTRMEGYGGCGFRHWIVSVQV